MRRKVGTILDADLYERAKAAAQRRGVTTNAMIEEALTRYLAGAERAASVVRETRGSYSVSRRALRAALHDDLYGAD
jgi:DNA-binding transcriptional MocR family regulator